MSQFVQPTVLLLKEGTDKSQGKAQIIHNINACQAVVDIIKTTLGPRGMDKLIYSGRKVTISNDGATIIKLLDIVHPAAKTLTDIAKSQDDEVGDGTTTVVLLAGELLKLAKPFIEDGVHSQTIIRGYRRAMKVVLDKIADLAVDLEKGDAEKLRDMLIKCAGTAMNSKLIYTQKDFFAPMVVDAVESLDQAELNLSMIGIKKVAGGSVNQSQLVQGVAFKKTFAYAGFEQQPKSFDDPLICLLNVELELKAEEATAEIRLENAEEYQKVVDAEWTIIYQKLDKVTQCGAKIVLSRLPIGDLATQYFADRDIFCAGRVADDDMRRLAAATGAVVQSTTSDLDAEGVLGTCGHFEERQVGAERYNFFEKCPTAKTCTMILRGGAEQFIEETERSLHDAIMIVKRCVQHKQIVGGGGAIEMELSRYLRHYSRQVKDKTQLIMSAYAKAFEIIPRQLAENAGFDATDIVNELRFKHAKGSRWFGVDITNEGVCDSLATFVWEPALNKKNAITAATEAACIILSIDETVRNPKARDPTAEKYVKNPNQMPAGRPSIR